MGGVLRLVATVVALIFSLAACASKTESDTEVQQIGKVSGNLVDWVDAACPSGTGTNEKPIGLGAFGGGICIGAPGDKSPPPPLLYEQFDSEDSMLSILESVNPTYYAAGEADGVVTAFFVMYRPFSSEQIDVLRSFGFVINRGPRTISEGETGTPELSVGGEVPSTASNPAPTPLTPTSGLRWRFMSPTGNIACDLNGTVAPPVAACEVRENTYKARVKPACDPGWATRFVLRQGQSVEVACYSGSEFGNALPVQDYGKPLSIGSITCVIEESSGVSCLDASSGHGFQAARQEYRLS